MKDEQLSIYGKVLDGKESQLEQEKLLRIQYLKTKLRRLLDYTALGDTKDILTDLLKVCILGWAIQRGMVSDKAITDRFDAAITAKLEFYGGAEFIIGMLEDNDKKMVDLMAKYYQAKKDILAAVSSESLIDYDIEDKAEE
jgi:hypothetical protein